MPICAAITTTMGGIVVDGNGAVLDQNDTPMPGLFAAGSTVGGLDGGPNAGYVGGLIKATIALRAAEAIAASWRALPIGQVPLISMSRKDVESSW